MSQIPFKLLSRKHKVLFERLTTEQGKAVFSHTKAFREAWNTEFLNAMQCKDTFLDAAKWSQQDRHVAMLIIYLEVYKDNFDKLQEKFELMKCQFCGEDHSIAVDYRELLNPDRPAGGIRSLKKLPEFKVDNTKYKIYPLNGRYLMDVENLHRQYPSGCIDALHKGGGEKPYREFLESNKYAALQEEKSILTICAYLHKPFSDFGDYFEYKNLWSSIEPLLPELDHGISWQMAFTCPVKKDELRAQYPEGAVNAMITKKTSGYNEFFKSDEFAALKKAERALEVVLPLPFRTLNKLQNM